MNKNQHSLTLSLSQKKPDVLLLGNGLNHGFEPSWKELLDGFSTGSLTKQEEKEAGKLPFPLQAVVLSGDDVESACKAISQKMMPGSVSEEQKKRVQLFTCVPADAILTTNYSYEIEKTISSDFDLRVSKSSKYRRITVTGNVSEKDLGFYKYMQIPTVTGQKIVCHIHGEAAMPKSIVLGHYYYGKVIAVVNNYLADLVKRVRESEKSGEDFTIKSWADYFFLGNIYIVGLGLDPSEIDLWWLINCKKKLFSEYGKVYYFEPDMNLKDKTQTRLLAETYGINICSKNIGKGGYEEFYQWASESIKDLIEKR